MLDGHALELVGLRVDGEPLGANRYGLDDEHLTIHAPPAAFELEITSRTRPDANTALEGLYLSSGVFCTQCEAEGFRRITWFPDRPDVMAVYRTRIEADREACPVLLGNGNLVEQGELPGGRHFAVWHDPFPKPSYLFALVAGDLARLEDRFTTRSGREVLLEIYADAKDIDKCDHAMASLKRAMKWDEDRFGLEYDLDRFMIVAVSDFNYGAMENKGLNIFNTKYVLAEARDGDRRGFSRHRDRGGARVFPQLDRRPGDLPRLVPAVAQGRPDGVPRPGVLVRPAFARGQADRRRAPPARRAVPRGRRPARPPGAARQLCRDRQLLHRRPCTRRAPRSSACCTP